MFFKFYGKSVERLNTWNLENVSDHFVVLLIYLSTSFPLFDQNSGVMDGRPETLALEESSLLSELDKMQVRQM